MMGAGACMVTERFVVEAVGWNHVRLRETCVESDHLRSWDSVERVKVQKNRHMLIDHCGCAETR